MDCFIGRFISMSLVRTLGLGLLLALNACGEQETSQQSEQKQHPLWQSQFDALEKAKQVEGMVKDQAAQRRRQIDEIEGQR